MKETKCCHTKGDIPQRTEFVNVQCLYFRWLHYKWSLIVMKLPINGYSIFFSITDWHKALYNLKVF